MLVPPRNVEALVGAIQTFLNNRYDTTKICRCCTSIRRRTVRYVAQWPAIGSGSSFNEAVD